MVFGVTFYLNFPITTPHHGYVPTPNPTPQITHTLNLTPSPDGGYNNYNSFGGGGGGGFMPGETNSPAGGKVTQHPNQTTS
jgi:hypothetical protein